MLVSVIAMTFPSVLHRPPLLRIVIIGCGIIGATVAYELSREPGITVQVLDHQTPAQASTGAALGVLMGAISHKTKGRAWRLREASLQRYDALIAEVEAITGQTIPYNRQGILSLCFDATELPRWQSLQRLRQQQGWPLEIWSPDHLGQACPHIDPQQVVAAIYSPRDRQVNPTVLTQALVDAAQHQGAHCDFTASVQALHRHGDGVTVETSEGSHDADRVIISAGLGSSALTAAWPQPVAMVPVLGQAVRLRLLQPLGKSDFQPVINGHDIHLVPLGHQEYWLGATVEFPPAEHSPTADPARLEAVVQGGVAYCPALATAEVVEQWQGLRPRPQGQPAPVIQPLAEDERIWLATGHYRNGVLLAPGTALTLKQRLMAE
ncbi:Glycine oxidase [Halomicronema hongdechloris C2206]|uniref:Glycine oxidase n=1 Tax=Halomicronema hongdechloris C2206 TaxID=1641165 RepID=A0A1Z3HS03_9CYAN|nr:FAD-dependent oxidoreductase [Halomicronema hongdechloris]ASC72907.1 Glycine oxidase [Halomicronema hongdechloris C2206]